MIEYPATRLAPWEAAPFQLWSLLDMQRFLGVKFTGAVIRFSHLAGACLERARTPEEAVKDREYLRQSLADVSAALAEVPLSEVLKRQAERFLSDMHPESGADFSDREIALLARELHFNLLNEMAAHLFLWVPSKRKAMFNRPEEWFGADIVNKFGAAAIDIRDCARCLALAQWTASVFHAMRVLEHGLHALAQRLQVTFATPMELENWKNIIDQIEKEVRKQEQLPKSIAKTEELQFCSRAASQFFYFKEAWRNHVSHGRATYDEAEATRIVEHVRDFMGALC